jgi:hypothetical protein
VGKDGIVVRAYWCDPDAGPSLNKAPGCYWMQSDGGDVGGDDVMSTFLHHSGPPVLRAYIPFTFEDRAG